MSIVEHDHRRIGAAAPVDVTGLPTRRWAGVLLDPLPPAGRATLASARWVVPEVSTADPAGRDDLTIAFWVGLDGGPGAGLLRAGISARVRPGTRTRQVRYDAWTRWDSDPSRSPAIATRLPIGAGDSVAVTVCADETRLGLVRMANLTRNLTMTTAVRAPAGVRMGNPAAAWIVQGVSATLPAFSPVSFTECAASSAGETFHLAPGGVAFDIARERGGPRLTRTSITSPTSAVVGWNGFV